MYLRHATAVYSYECRGLRPPNRPIIQIVYMTLNLSMHVMYPSFELTAYVVILNQYCVVNHFIDLELWQLKIMKSKFTVLTNASSAVPLADVLIYLIADL